MSHWERREVSSASLKYLENKDSLLWSLHRFFPNLSQVQDINLTPGRHKAQNMVGHGLLLHSFLSPNTANLGVQQVMCSETLEYVLTKHFSLICSWNQQFLLICFTLSNNPFWCHLALHEPQVVPSPGMDCVVLLPLQLDSCLLVSGNLLKTASSVVICK